MNSIRNSSPPAAALVAPDAFSIWVFRRPLIAALQRRGWAVHAIAAADGYESRLTGLRGVSFSSVPFPPRNSVLGDCAAAWRLAAVLKGHRFELVHAFGPKPNMLAGVLAPLLGVQRVYLSVTGMGFLSPEVSGPGVGARLMRAIGGVAYLIAGRMATGIWFQNRDDRAYFQSRRFVSEEAATLIISSGIDPEEWSDAGYSEADKTRIREALGISPDTVVLLMVARCLLSKGVKEFVECARLFAGSERPLTRFVLAGPAMPDRAGGYSADELRSLEAEISTFLWLGERDDVRDLMAAADVFVLPSYYGEGVPRSVLEAMAMRLPVVTTTSPGCRETVEESVSGFLVQPKSTAELHRAVKTLVIAPDQRKRMGAAARVRASTVFNADRVAEQLVKQLYGIAE